MKNGIKYALKWIGLFIYFSLALFLIVLAAGGAAGGLLLGDAWSGVGTLFVGAMLVALGLIGKEMLTKIKVGFEALRLAFKKAAESVEDDPKKK